MSIKAIINAMWCRQRLWQRDVDVSEQQPTDPIRIGSLSIGPAADGALLRFPKYFYRHWQQYRHLISYSNSTQWRTSALTALIDRLSFCCCLHYRSDRLQQRSVPFGLAPPGQSQHFAQECLQGRVFERCSFRVTRSEHLQFLFR